jgi:uncharacterized membrane protein YjfL (UPF0719 family)
MGLMLVALLRKALFLGMLFVAYFLFDRVVLSDFDTGKVIQNDPKAVGILLGALAIAAALA